MQDRKRIIDIGAAGAVNITHGYHHGAEKSALSLSMPSASDNEHYVQLRLYTP